MKYSTFVANVEKMGKIDIPKFIQEKLDLTEDDYVEVTLIKIKSKKMQMSISHNPLLKLLKDTK